MDSLHFDPYGCYSDSSSSAPRTPSPHDLHFANHTNIKQQPIDVDPRLYPHDLLDDNTVPIEPHYWNNVPPPNPRGSLLQELYDHDHDLPEHHQQYQHWSQQQQPFLRTHDYTTGRRATYPYVRHDRDDAFQHYPASFLPPQQHTYPSPPDTLYGESSQDAFIPSISSSPHQPYQEFDDTPAIKLEDGSPSLASSHQPAFYPTSSSSACHSMNMSPYLSGLPVQHTDDAASKETQYLRRRCFNCHTTEPPSWRRSTLNPGKIVCNKCGLYERTHLRPRPLRFDELRAGNKARKASQGKGASPKAKLTHIKKEPREFGIMRRNSVSSTSSIHSGSGVSDWDDNVSVYSNGSAPPTSFSSPNVVTFPLSRDSQSPPRDGGIRLPNAPLSDIASIQPTPASSPRKSHSAPSAYYSPPSSTDNGEYYLSDPLSEVKVQPQETSVWGTSVTSSPRALELPIPAEDSVAAVPLVLS